MQKTATIKCLISNASYTIRNNNTVHRTATPKCTIPNAGNTLWNNKATQRTATIKCHVTNNLCPLFYGISTIKSFSYWISTIKFLWSFKQFSSIFAIFYAKFISNGLI